MYKMSFYKKKLDQFLHSLATKLWEATYLLFLDPVLN